MRGAKFNNQALWHFTEGLFYFKKKDFQKIYNINKVIRA